MGSYLIGAIPIGLLVAKSRGVDIRRHGSGNYGATNVGRVLGRKWGMLVLLLDAMKGAATSVFAAPCLALFGVEISEAVRDWLWLGTGVCCVVGNTAPIYLRFKGGKGVATSLGVIIGIYPYLTYSALVALIVWIATVLLTRYVSLASILAALAVPTALAALSGPMEWTLSDHYPLLGLTLVAAAVVIFRHRSNIGRLLAGTESKVGQSGSNAISPGGAERP
ncbi:MAG: glycerol-3-phosphate 1-O-acyltransferase PlsY [Phycisphaerae bacterium]|nr:glycerol-3-phosphate 1-O-acyltransferase PlsY [Phycisphaerae bacterium]